MTNTLDRTRNRLHFFVHCNEQYVGDPTPEIVRRSAIRKEAFALLGELAKAGGVAKVGGAK